MGTDLQAPVRTYRVRTYGCQMNVHDSERLSGLLRRTDSYQLTAAILSV